MRPETRIPYSLRDLIAALAARSAAEDTGNQPSALRDIERIALGWSWRAALIAMTLVATAACDKNPVGPSLADVEVRDVRVEPTQGNATLCCCRVAAIAANRNTVNVHVTVKFFVYDNDPSYPVAGLVHFIDNMDPGSEQQIVAQGLVFACSRVKDVQVEVDVTRPSTTGS
jgi:hypothetical protein